MNAYGSGYEHVQGSCDNGNELSSSIKCDDFRKYEENLDFREELCSMQSVG
jgi:hypothetical protein